MTHHAADDDILYPWNSLVKNVEDISRSATSSGFGQSPAAFSDLNALSPEINHFRNNPIFAEKLLSAFVWQFLSQRIFGNEELDSGNFWLEVPADQKAPLRLSDIEQAQHQRAFIARQFQLDPEVCHHRLAYLGDALVGRLRQYLQSSSALEDRLREVVEQAVSLDADMQKQSAHYFVRFYPLVLATSTSFTPISQRFDKYFMREDGESSDPSAENRPGTSSGRHPRSSSRGPTSSNRPGTSSGERPRSRSRPRTSGNRPGTSSNRPGTSSGRPKSSHNRPGTSNGPARPATAFTGNRVALVVTPALLRAGHMTGHSFGSQYVLSRASVITTRQLERQIPGFSIDNVPSTSSRRPSSSAGPAPAPEKEAGCCCIVM
ncbi:hypothetical protein EJ06DRAFT_67930 [Trichodelitschia bisporula]|uniref:Uncharacterized protein n=1 Tax=Trichodelitschia bisporula TaxID=703511 RepID=A0A6G1HTH0_9PEZI|nr:hypothetical protein EJ06DRAFT_67930 [Trichodelitschia bisporula]